MLLLILLAALAAGAIAGLTLITLRSRLTPGPSLVGETVVVHTRKPDDQSVRGILHGQHADRWSLRDAEYLHASGPAAMDGLVHIPVAAISTVQQINPPAAD